MRDKSSQEPYTPRARIRLTPALLMRVCDRGIAEKGVKTWSLESQRCLGSPIPSSFKLLTPVVRTVQKAMQPGRAGFNVRRVMLKVQNPGVDIPSFGLDMSGYWSLLPAKVGSKLPKALK